MPRLDLPSGLTVDTESPNKISTPKRCDHCKILYYGHHFCTEKDPIIRTSFKGYYDG